MLEELHVQNYALIESAEIRFTKRLNVLTGETGAGKSILVGALGLILGKKADTSVVREGTDEAVVSAVIDIRSSEFVKKWLSEKSIQDEDGRIIIRRTVRSTGRGIVFIQSTPVTLEDIRTITQDLFDMHGQHQHQSLLSNDNQRRLLDQYGGLEDDVAALRAVFNEWTAQKKRFENITRSQQEREREIELLEHAIKEIDEAGLKKGEEEDVERELKLLAQHEKFFTKINTFKNLTSGRKSLIDVFSDARTVLGEMIDIDPGLSSLYKRMDEAYYEVDDIIDSVVSYADKMLFDPGRLTWCEDRLALIHRLEKKYGPSFDDIFVYRNEAESKLEDLRNSSFEKDKILARIKELEALIKKEAQSISLRRKEAAVKLQDEILKNILELGMSKADFKVEITGLGSNKNSCGPNGLEKVEFMITPNAGEPLKKLKNIASGGEISRIMLAIKTVLAEIDDVQSLIFDEIDTGIGGEIAIAVGKHMKRIARNKQVLTITHLATIASFADNHIRVEKNIRDGRTITAFTTVTEENRVSEIARMLSGDTSSDASVRHAEQLIDQYGAMPKDEL